MGTGRARQDWIDLLRGIAVVGMVWTHAANTFLDGKLQGTQAFQNLTFYHGLVSPLFFWVAGYMRGLSAARSGPHKPAWPTVKRLLLILGTGYLMHIPWLPLLGGDFSPPVLQILFQSDVLQALAVSCLLLLAIERAPMTLGTRRLITLALGLTILLMTPSLQSVKTGLLPLDAFLSNENGSLFPLFPWAAFACAGFLVGTANTVAWPLFGFAALAAFALPFVSHGPATLSFFFERLGWITMAAVLVMKGSHWLQGRSIALPRWLLLAGRASLCVYITHLILIYWLPIWGWAREGCSWWVVAGIFASVATLSLGVAGLKERRNGSSPRLRSRQVFADTRGS